MSIKYKNSDIMSASDVSSLFSLKIQDNQLVQTQGYSVEGVGSNLYRYDLNATGTIDGGFVLPGLGGTLSFSGVTFNGTSGTGRLIAIDRTTADVTKFGAKGDGTSDDTQALKLAINTMTSGTGGLVYFPQGTYPCTDQLTIPSYGRVAGASSNTSTISFDSSGFKIGRYSRLEKLLVLGSSTASSVGIDQTNPSGGDYYFSIYDCHVADFEAGIKLTRVWNASIDKCRITSNDVYGIYLSTSLANLVTINHCAINQNGVGLYVTAPAANCSVRSCTIENSTSYGIRLNGAPVRSMTIDDTYFEGNASGHIFNEGNSYSCCINNNSFFGNQLPINMAPAGSFDYQVGTAIEGNYFEDLSTARTYDIVLANDKVYRTSLKSDGGVWTNSTGGTGGCARVSDSGLYTERLKSYSLWDRGTSGAAKTIFWNVNWNAKLTLDQNTVLTFTDPVIPCRLLLVLIQDSGGTNTITWPTINWKGSGLQPDATGSSISIFEFYFDGANYHELSVNN